jgi:hypothetical protein
MRSAVAAVTMERMNALIVYESMYGNTRLIAQAIAEGLGGATVQSTREDADVSADLLIVGGPTHMHGLTTSASRRMAADASRRTATGSSSPARPTPPACASGCASCPRRTAPAPPLSTPESTALRP